MDDLYSRFLEKNGGIPDAEYDRKDKELKPRIEDVYFDFFGGEPIDALKKYLKYDRREYSDYQEELGEFREFKDALISKFLKTYDIGFFGICLYHGTDAFVLEHDGEVIQKYRTAMKKYKDVFLEHEDDYKDNKGWIGWSGKWKTEKYQYDNIYVTTNPCLAYGTYGEHSGLIGELGFYHQLFRKAVEKTGKELELDEETKNALNEMYKEMEGRERKTVLLKYRDLSMIEAKDNGDPYDPEQLKRDYLTGYEYDNLEAGAHLGLFRMKKELSLRSFELVENPDDEAEVVRENRKRVKRAYADFVESFIELNNAVFESIDSFRAVSNEVFGIRPEWNPNSNHKEGGYKSAEEQEARFKWPEWDEAMIEE